MSRDPGSLRCCWETTNNSEVAPAQVSKRAAILLSCFLRIAARTLLELSEIALVLVRLDHVTHSETASVSLCVRMKS